MHCAERLASEAWPQLSLIQTKASLLAWTSPCASLGLLLQLWYHLRLCLWYAPYKPRHRYWPGLLLVLHLVFFFGSGTICICACGMLLTNQGIAIGLDVSFCFAWSSSSTLVPSAFVLVVCSLQTKALLLACTSSCALLGLLLQPWHHPRLCCGWCLQHESITREHYIT